MGLCDVGKMGMHDVGCNETLEHVTDHYVIFIMISQCAYFAHHKL